MIPKLLGKSRFLDADLEDYCLETWAWLTDNLAGAASRRPWVTPTREFFPPTDREGEARVQHLFDHIRSAMGMADWPCVLEPYDRLDPSQQVGEHLFVKTPDMPGGLFWVKDGEAHIQYARDLSGQPQQLTATLAHELCHYRLAALEDPPGAEAEIAHELATELCVAWMGFGVFAANSAFEFAQHGDAFGQGWRVRRSGYLSERAWAFALALFAAQNGEGAPERWLKPGVLDMARKAERYLAKNPRLLSAAPARALS